MGGTGTAWLSAGFCALGQAAWCLAALSEAEEHVVDTSQHTGQGTGGGGLTRPFHKPRTQLTSHMHATTTSHKCRAQPGPVRMEGKVREGGLWAIPSHLALSLPSPPSIASLVPGWACVWLTISPGVTAAATAAGGGGGVCAGKEGVISTIPQGTWGPWSAWPSQAHPTVPTREAH